jgi:uncharacterized membrane protein
MKEQIFETLSKLVEINLQLFKIEIKQEVSGFLVQMAMTIILIIFANMVLVLGSFAAAFLLGEFLGKLFYGFSIVTLFYIILLTIAIVNRKQIEASIRKQIQKSMIKEENKELAHLPEGE